MCVYGCFVDTSSFTVLAFSLPIQALLNHTSDTVNFSGFFCCLFKLAEGKNIGKDFKMSTGKQQDSIFLNQTDVGKVDLVQLGKSFLKDLHNYKNTSKANNSVMP